MIFDMLRINNMREVVWMKQKLLLVCGVFCASLAMISFVGFEVVIFKPWASCSYGDTSTECTSTELENLLLSIFFYFFLAGLFGLICILSYWTKTRIFPERNGN